MQEFMQAIEPIRKIGEKTGGAPVDPPDPPEDSAVKALLHFSADPVGSMAGALVDETGRAWEVLQGIFSTIDALNMTPPTSLWLQAGQYAAI